MTTIDAFKSFCTMLRMYVDNATVAKIYDGMTTYVAFHEDGTYTVQKLYDGQRVNTEVASVVEIPTFSQEEWEAADLDYEAIQETMLMNI